MKTANQGKSWTPEEDLTALVNGTETRTDWNSVDWQEASENVRRLRQRIFRATQEGDYKKVRSLQKLMLRSYSNRLVSVRRVTQQNAGSKTPGVDKVICKTPRSRGLLVDMLASYQPWKAMPAKRVYIPKANGKLRPLGIPTIRDRALQAMVKNALEPSWEARFEASSYGFRPGRGCHDAITRIFLLASGKNTKRWILDADIKGAFDNIAHDHLLKTIGLVPGRELIKQWLKAGYVEMGTYHDTDAGTPQGGVISPLLANIALHGMEEALTVYKTFKNGKTIVSDEGIKYDAKGWNHGNRAVVRYADDFVVFTTTKEDAEKIKEILAEWLAQRGLTFSEEKTRIVNLDEGFDFLSFNVRHYKVTDRPSGRKLLIKPSKEAVKRRKETMRDIWMSMRNKPVEKVCTTLNPIIRGWANYHRTVVATETFKKMDAWMYKRGTTHLHFMHPKKSWEWLKERYYGLHNEQHKDNWVLGNKKTGVHLLKFAWFKIERHVMVKGTASPDDPSLRQYWEERRMSKINRFLSKRWRILAARQKGKCPICGESIVEDNVGSVITSTEEVHAHHKQPRKQGGSNQLNNLQLVHLYCHQQIHAKLRKQEEAHVEAV